MTTVTVNPEANRVLATLDTPDYPVTNALRAEPESSGMEPDTSLLTPSVIPARLDTTLLTAPRKPALKNVFLRKVARIMDSVNLPRVNVIVTNPPPRVSGPEPSAKNVPLVTWGKTATKCVLVVSTISVRKKVSVLKDSPAPANAPARKIGEARNVTNVSPITSDPNVL